MYSLPFTYDYGRPKQCYNLFDDDLYHPFSSAYYVREQPSLFRSSSFRQPARQFCETPSFAQRKQSQSSDEDDDYDPFLNLFGLRTSSKPTLHKSNTSVKQSEAKRESKSEPKSEAKSEVKQKSIKSQSKSTKLKDKELISQRFDTDSEIEYQFKNYKCKDPSGISVTITKDDYIVLTTSDGYEWKNRLPSGVDVSKASCTCIRECLKLKLPKIIEKSDQMECEVNKQVTDKNEQMSEETSVEQSNLTEESKIVERSNLTEESKVTEQSKVDQEFDPDAPIVEDIVEDD